MPKSKSKPKPYSWLAETGLDGVPKKVVPYRDFDIKLNPLTDDWLVDIGGEYGAYVGSLSAMKSVVDRYYKHMDAR